ncbi:MAG: hypothetical protein WA090_06155 [Candidatus Nanopelagicaceae bacterium]
MGLADVVDEGAGVGKVKTGAVLVRATQICPGANGKGEPSTWVQVVPDVALGLLHFAG